MSFLAWIDFDQADRDRTRRIMDLFGQEDSRDELGLGSVRDALSDLLFPGTSTIQTRLRYMFFVPWIYQMAGRTKGSPHQRRERARALEISLIDALTRGQETNGVIGRDARETLKRLPSDVYWAGLRTLGIRRFQGSRNACLEAVYAGETNLWAPGLPSAPEDFLLKHSAENAVTFDLSPQEISFLRDRLAQEAPHSLLTLLAQQEAFQKSPTPWGHPDKENWPEDIRFLVTHAELFSILMNAAALLYNLMLCEKRAAMAADKHQEWTQRLEEYADQLDQWRSATDMSRLAQWRLEDLWTVASQSNHRIKDPTRRFVQGWLDVVVATQANLTQSDDARRIIARRERHLKGAKARLQNDAALARWGGASGTAPLTYRWTPVVSNHLDDLCNDGTDHAGT
ncbi:DUF6361 family protein [Shimia sp. MIT1388]|uniref:DUF6361 family protein n=1 Tax=Shimia sp. MIT1388 TaxID=3096992 RepID=UPI003999BFCF